MLNSEEHLRFEQLVLPHLDSAFNLAAWLLRSRADAEDVVQEALLRFVPVLSDVSWDRRPRLALANCAQWLLHVAAQKSAVGMHE